MPLILITLPAFADTPPAGPAPRPDQTSPSPKAMDCYCTDATRQRLELGATTCLVIGGKPFLAQCQMSLNVPMWRKLRDGCPVSSLPSPLAQPVQPAG